MGLFGITEDNALIPTLLVAGFCVNLWCAWKIRSNSIEKKKPYRIYLLRHGESEGNVDRKLFTFIPDHAIPLSENGQKQSAEAGAKLRQMIGNEHARFWVSPYQRTRQTFQIISQSFDKDKITWRDEPRLREQDWGNFQDFQLVNECRLLRKRFGHFFYRIPAGESGADVFDRVSNFLESLFRDFSSHPTRNIVLVSHGITCRLFLMRFLHWPFEKFQRMQNLENCEILILEKQPDNRYLLITPLKESDVTESDEWDDYARGQAALAAMSPSSVQPSEERLSHRHRKLLSNMV